MANAQRNAAKNFTRDTESFLALLRSGASAEKGAESGDEADGTDGVAAAFPGLEQAVAAMRDLIVEIPDDSGQPGGSGEPAEQAEPEDVAFEEPETFEEAGTPEKPDDPAFEAPDAGEDVKEDAAQDPHAAEEAHGEVRDTAADTADELEKSIRSLLAEEPRREGRSELDLLDFEEPDSSRPPYKDVDFEALTASLRRDGPEAPDAADAEDADDE